MSRPKLLGLDRTYFSPFELTQALHSDKDMLARINDSIGAMRLTEIRPQHLNEFYKYLSEVGIRDSKEKAIAKVNLESMVARRGIPKDRLAKTVGLAPTTFRNAISGNQVSLRTAEKVAEALGMEVKDAFRVSKDTSKLSNKTILEYHRLISTIMIASGIDLVTTVNELGHANATTTATIYAHQITVAKAKASEARASVFSRVKAGNE